MAEMVETCRRTIELFFVVAMAKLSPCVASILLWQTSIRVLMWDAHMVKYCVLDAEVGYLALFM